MELISKQGTPDLALVYVARFRSQADLLAEFVDARDPDLSPDAKWVIIVSTQFGCPAACPMCDAGGDYKGNLTTEEIFSQIDYIVKSHPRERLLTSKFKIQFARMGEPAFNKAVLDVLRDLPKRYDAPGLIPCIATIAPLIAKEWFDELLSIRGSVYKGRAFQLQLSINSTDDKIRDILMPPPKISIEELGLYANNFSILGPRKVSLNFALAEGVQIDPMIISRNFDPKSVCVKITPLNPTIRSVEMGLKTALPPDAPAKAENLCNEFKKLGFDVILSIGDVRENTIGSNCGMAVRKLL